jgi:lipoate-protein ligase A
MPGVVVTIVVGERELKSAHAAGEIHAIFDTIHDAMTGLLSPFIERGIAGKGISDLAIGEKKVLGSSLYLGRNPDFYYYQSSLMVDCDCLLIERYLKHPPREPGYRSGRSHADFCTSLAREGASISPSEIIRLFSENLAGLLGN